MTKSVLMKKAWGFAKGMAKKLGGVAYQYIAEGMKRAWALFGKEVITKKVEKKPFVKGTPLNGRMTEKQESFIASLLRKKTTDNPVAQAFEVSSLRSTITKQQASSLIEDLLAA